MSIAREGWPFIGVLMAAAALLAFRFPWPAGVLAALGFFCAFFFRDPDRALPAGEALVLSPADGKVVKVALAPPGSAAGEGAQQISIFLSIFDVHVNRSPIAGRIERVDYHPGEFLPAWDDKASLRNEQNTVTVERNGQRVVFKQIAGLIARRILCYVKPGDAVQRGQRYGFIRFGSRVDVYLPVDSTPKVAVGDNVFATETVLAVLQ